MAAAGPGVSEGGAGEGGGGAASGEGGAPCRSPPPIPVTPPPHSPPPLPVGWVCWGGQRTDPPVLRGGRAVLAPPLFVSRRRRRFVLAAFANGGSGAFAPPPHPPPGAAGSRAHPGGAGGEGPVPAWRGGGCPGPSRGSPVPPRGVAPHCPPWGDLSAGTCLSFRPPRRPVSSVIPVICSGSRTIRLSRRAAGCRWRAPGGAPSPGGAARTLHQVREAEKKPPRKSLISSNPPNTWVQLLPPPWPVATEPAPALGTR